MTEYHQSGSFCVPLRTGLLNTCVGLNRQLHGRKSSASGSGAMSGQPARLFLACACSSWTRGLPTGAKRSPLRGRSPHRREEVLEETAGTSPHHSPTISPHPRIPNPTIVPSHSISSLSMNRIHNGASIETNGHGIFALLPTTSAHSRLPSANTSL